MRFIIKGTEPRKLLSYRKQPFASYAGLPQEVKNDIRTSLLKEQGYLCAYCMRRIDARHMKIEHWLPQSPASESRGGSDAQYDAELEALDYNNMLAVCTGQWPGGATTCDTHRGNEPLTINPLDEMSVADIAYDRDGTIKSADSSLQKDLDKTLNLNMDLLKLNRQEALSVCLDKLRRLQKDGTWNHQMLGKMLQFYEQTDAAAKRIEYSGIVIYFLRKRIKR